MSKDIKIEDCIGHIVVYKSNTTKDSSWNGKIRDITPDEEGDIEINGCKHQLDSIRIFEILNINN